MNLSPLKKNLKFHSTQRKPLLLGLSLIFIFCSSLVSKAQDTTNADGLFEAARKEAFEKKNFTEALRLSKKALDINPKYNDILIFTGRVHTWNNEPDSGRIYLQRALKQNPPPEEAFVAYSDLEYWNKNYPDALRITQQGLNSLSYSFDLLLRKAKILEAMKDYTTAILVTDTLLKMNRGNTEARKLNIALREKSAKNKFAVKLDYAHFDKQFKDDWYFGSVEYTRVTSLGPIVARLNYADRFRKEGVLYEVDAYPRISRVFYMYLNTGYCNNNNDHIFPKWRSGLSLFANLPHAFEAEGGIRYLYYNSDIFFYTFYAGKYYKSFLFGARTYINSTANGIANANSVMARYYYGSSDDYINLTLGAGISPDNRQLNLQVNNTGKLRTYSGELVLRHALRKLKVVSVNFSLLNQEYFPGIIGNQIQAGVGYMRRF
jgi:YaiO family outer membrane protein